VIAVDSNILVHAHRADSPWHAVARDRVRPLSAERWGIPWPCVHEFLAIVTHPRLFDPPTPAALALEAANAWVGAPTVILLAEQAGFWEVLREILESSQVTGPRVYDARIAALRLHHAVDELWTADRDFSRFRGLRVTNPLV
jgi:hypothetical protein